MLACQQARIILARRYVANFADFASKIGCHATSFEGSQIDIQKMITTAVYLLCTAMDQKLQNHKKVILPTITSSKCQRDAGHMLGFATLPSISSYLTDAITPKNKEYKYFILHTVIRCIRYLPAGCEYRI